MANPRPSDDAWARFCYTEVDLDKEHRRYRTMSNRVPWWLFATIAAGALLASGIYLGIMSVEGFAGVRIAQAAGFGLLGLLMLWGATHSR
jgi:hypothetical protein